jgi:hypothetical protein
VQSASHGAGVGDRMPRKEFRLSNPSREKGIIFVGSFSDREVPKKMSEQERLMGIVVPLDRYDVAKAWLMPTIDETCEAFS